MYRLSKLIPCLFVIALLSGCASQGSSIAGNDQGSKPVNENETIQYKRAILKCYKTGGSRVVKIQGKLKCY